MYVPREDNTHILLPHPVELRERVDGIRPLCVLTLYLWIEELARKYVLGQYQNLSICLRITKVFC